MCFFKMPQFIFQTKESIVLTMNIQLSIYDRYWEQNVDST